MRIQSLHLPMIMAAQCNGHKRHLDGSWVGVLTEPDLEVCVPPCFGQTLCLLSQAFSMHQHCTSSGYQVAAL
jgi:hypothetical protein